MMTTATAIIAPHGAGLVNMFVCRRNTLIVEYMNRKGDAHILYMVMALKLGLRYIGIPVMGLGQKNSDKMIDISQTVNMLDKYLYNA